MTVRLVSSVEIVRVANSFLWARASFPLGRKAWAPEAGVRRMILSDNPARCFGF